MNKWTYLLGGLLLAQLVAATAIKLGEHDYGAFQAQEKMLAFNPQQVDGLRISGDGEEVLLRKRDGRWLLPNSGDFPADQTAVGLLLQKLAGLEKGWPVATSGGAAKRFQTATDDFQRRLSLLSGDATLAELFMGSSPGFRKVHARPAGDEAVYAAPFEAWEASPKTDDWIDKSILKLDADSIEVIELPNVVLERAGDAFKVKNLAANETAKETEIESLIRRLAGLTIQSVLGTEAKPEYRQDQPALEIKVMRKDAEPLSYLFSKPDKESYYLLKRSDLKDYFTLSEISVKLLLGATRQELVTTQANTATDTAEPGAASPPAAAPATATPDKS